MALRTVMLTVSTLMLVSLSLGCEPPADHAVSPQAAEPPTPQTADAVRPLLVGARAPKVTLRDTQGAPVDLTALLAKKPTVLVFYRGGWCMYCNTQLGQLKQAEAKILESGWQIVAVSPDRPAKLAESLAKHELNYSLLSDSDMAAARAFGVAFRLDDETVTKYQGYGIDLDDASGRDHHLLPVPAVFLLDAEGTIVFQYVNPNYAVRLHPDVLLAAVASHASKPDR
jgi:peroxiredoxin